MSKKSKAERQAAHARFEQRQTITKGQAQAGPLPADTIRIAAEFLLSAQPERASDISMIPDKVLNNIALGRFTPSVNQSRQIETAAKKAGWSGPSF